jgi:hypothetical protein
MPTTKININNNVTPFLVFPFFIITFEHFLKKLNLNDASKIGKLLGKTGEYHATDVLTGAGGCPLDHFMDGVMWMRFKDVCIGGFCSESGKWNHLCRVFSKNGGIYFPEQSPPKE